MVNKRGQGLTVGTLIIIILAIVVLVFLVYGFSVGWGNLFDNITNIGGGKSNVGAVVTACELACNTGSEFDYCGRTREVKFGRDGKVGDGMYNCKALESEANSGLNSCVQFASCQEEKKLNNEPETSVLCSQVGNNAKSEKYASPESKKIDSGKCNSAGFPGSTNTKYLEITDSNLENVLKGEGIGDKPINSFEYKLSDAENGKICCLMYSESN